MTAENFLRFCKFSKAKQSRTKILYKDKNEIPLYVIEEVVNKPGDKQYNYYHFDKKFNEYIIRRFIWEEGMLANYLIENRADELQELLDKGHLYSTIERRIHKAERTINRMVEQIANTDTEMLTAKNDNDINKYRRLKNGLTVSIRNEIYKKMVFI